MVEPTNKESVKCAKATLQSLLKLVIISEMYDRFSLSILKAANHCFDELVENRDHYIGTPDDDENHQAKRLELENDLYPSC